MAFAIGQKGEMMDDELITREDALNAINRIWDRCEEIEAHLPDGDPDKTGYKMIADYLTVWKYLSAQPEIKTDRDMISRQAVYEMLDSIEIPRNANWYLYYHQALDGLSKLPSAQPEIVHCENCEHWKNEHLCECLSRHGTFETPKDFFCGYGKAK